MQCLKHAWALGFGLCFLADVSLFGGTGKPKPYKWNDSSPKDKPLLIPESIWMLAVSGAASLVAVLAQCWPVLGALFFSGTFFVLAFPFFTYVPSGGTFGQDLAKVATPLYLFTPSVWRAADRHV